MKVGDVVKLNSSKVLMTIRWFRTDASDNIVTISCEWMDYNMQVREHEFKPECITPVEER